MAATRDGYRQALLELADNQKVVVLEADLGKSANLCILEKSILTELSLVELESKICYLLVPVLHQVDIFLLQAHLQFLLKERLSK